MITAGNILRHELIGLPVEVVHSANPAQVGIAGRIIDETRNTLVIETSRGIKRIGKAHATFRLRIPDGTVVEVSGSALVSQPERRISKASKTSSNTSSKTSSETSSKTMKRY